MSKFSDLQATHEELVNKAQASGDILDQVQQYLKDIQSGSSQVSSARERDQLRANLRYWAGYVYEKTKEYPNVDLLPSSVPPQPDRRLLFSLAGAALVLLLFCALGYFALNSLSSLFVAADTGATATMEALVAQQTQDALTSPTLPPTERLTETPTVTPSGTFSPLTPTPTLAESEITLVQITSVQDNDQVKPTASISGTYSNLAPGSSIHLIIQPLSQNGLRFPAKQYALVSANSTSGEWTIEAKFGQGSQLEKQEDYILSIAVAPDEETRNKLLELVDTGFQEYPSGVFQFAQKVVVSRPAYTTVIDGIQVIYSSYLEEEGNLEIFTMNPDGSGQHRITYTSGLNELFPSLSPDGKQIVYVGRKNAKNNLPVYSIDVIDSDGSNHQVLVNEVLTRTSSLIYEHPLWSSDGAYVAYAVGTPQPNGTSYWNIFVYDMQRKESFQVTEGEHLSDRYFCWIPGTLDLIFDAITDQSGVTNFVRINIFNPKDTTMFFSVAEDQMQPALSLDGTKLAYVQLDKREGNIYAVTIPGGTPVKVTTSQFQDEKPVWGPDDETIFFVSFDKEFANIWSVKQDGTDLKQLTHGKNQYPYVGYMYATIP